MFKFTAVSTILAAICANEYVSAFAPQTYKSRTNIAVYSTEESELPPAPVATVMSQSMPFMECPPALNGAYAGDVGFDPFGFSKTEADLKRYREAEIKHSRLAMLAAAGWPISELLDKKIATLLNLAPVVDAGDRVPSLLNGGLGQVSPVYWVAVLGLAAAVEVVGFSKSNDVDHLPGDYKFDPLGLYPTDVEGQMKMQLAEIKHGRLAMIAISAFAAQEAVSKIGVVDETPFFFQPITQWASLMHDYANSGYVYH